MSNNIRITGINSGLDTDSMISALNKSYQAKIDSIKKQKDNVQYQADAWDNLNGKIYSFYSDTLSKARFKSTFDSTKATTSSNAISVTSTNDNANHIVEVVSKAQTGYVTGEKLYGINKNSKASDLGIESGTYSFNGKEIYIDSNQKVSSIVDTLNKNGVKATFDDNQKRFFISAKESGKDEDIDFENSSNELLKSLGLGNEKSVYLSSDGSYFRDKEMTQKIEDKTEISNIKNGKASIRVAGSDAEIILDGASYTSKSNNINVSGLSITINNETNERINISSSKDYSKTIDAVKDLVNKYNDLMKQLSKSYNTSRDKYEPLTDDEKDSMSESQVSKWEEKLKNSALYKDGSLKSIMNSLNNSFADSIYIDGTKRNYIEFGLSRNNYLSSSVEDRYSFKIDEDKLLKALQEDEEGTLEYFSKLSERMYNNLGKQMSKSPTLSSAYKVYNDKAMSKKISSYDQAIAKWQDKLGKAEDKYYKQFAKMEKALANLNSQTNYFNSFFNTKA